MSQRRLIEEWLPIAELGVESLRERTPMTPFPAPNRLHVWWARRPLVASRAAILASLLPEDADRERFMHVLGIHGDPVKAQKSIARARRTGVRVADPYGYARAFGYVPDASERRWIDALTNRGARSAVLDPTGGGGSIPFESVRLGFETWSNDLNPVAVLIQRATVDWPMRFGRAVVTRFEEVGRALRERLEHRLTEFFPQDFSPQQLDLTYLWARTITCPHCEGLVPLSPNWRLAPDGTGVRLRPNTSTRRCEFEIVSGAAQQSAGTVVGGDGKCPFPDCNRPIDGDHIKVEAQAGRMGEQLYAIVYKRKLRKATKAGRMREAWERGYRSPGPNDDVGSLLAARFAEKMPEWEALDLIPGERLLPGHKTDEPRRYGMARWREMFSRRQLLCHGTAVEVYRELLREYRDNGVLDELTGAAFGYVAFALSKLLNWNAILSSWNVEAVRLRSVFDRHDFAFKWSFGEMAPLVDGLGYDWAIKETAKCVGELVDLVRPAEAIPKGSAANRARRERHGDLFAANSPLPKIELTCKSADALDHVADGSIDCVVMDPPYYDNVMYAELSDFFYVWLKRTAGQIYPELFRRQLTDKEQEAVANPARFRGEKGAKALAGREYQQRMAAIFAECRRVLKPDGVMTLMFTHKATGAWDALTKGLMEAGFAITASWPVNTEAEGSLHIKNKAAANSTIFLVCRPRVAKDPDDTKYWEDIEPHLAAEVRAKVEVFQKAGIRGVDLYLASFGPALQEFSRHWPVRRGQPRPAREDARRQRQAALLLEQSDPYEATPEDALEAARRVVKDWRLRQLTQQQTRADLDATTAWFVLAWDSFRAPQFSYDEALQLARAVGVDLERDIVGRVAEKKADQLVLLDADTRVAKGKLGSADGSRGMIDVLHHAAFRMRSHGAEAAREQLRHTQWDGDPRLLIALEALLEVLPVPPTFGGADDDEGGGGHASDFGALEKLRRLAYSEQVDKPQQLVQLELELATPP